MTSAVDKPSSIPYVDENDLLSLAADLGHGVFPSADLYNWYARTVTDEGGREPVGKRKFGVALKEAGWSRSSRYLDGRMVRCWTITKPWARRGQEWLKSQVAEAENKS
jgi:hypothetical protein